MYAIRSYYAYKMTRLDDSVIEKNSTIVLHLGGFDWFNKLNMDGITDDLKELSSYNFV